MYRTFARNGSSQTSNANILSSLLAILEPGPTDDAEEASARSKPLIFIIDEFDLFAHHSVRQSFLYCLLDCIQGGFRRGGMAVLGLSARADCIETLEKRVKSRCQSRVHHLLPAEDVLTGVAKTAKDAMTLNTLDVASPVEADWNEGIEVSSVRDGGLLLMTWPDACPSWLSSSSRTKPCRYSFRVWTS